MTRSFTDRVLAGVCGGLAAALGINAWWLRAAFVILTVLSLGVFAVLYLLLWWIVPQESFIARQRGRLSVPLVAVLAMLALLAWAGRDLGYLRVPTTGADLFWPGALLLLSLVFFLRQVKA